MKTFQTSKVWVIIYSTLTITGAVLPCDGFQTPYIKASTTPWWTNPQNSPIFVSNQKKEPNPELTCISTNQNIFQIVEESKAHCKGQDYRINFYLQTGEDYTKLDSLLIDKHLFHNLLMKYSDWSLTSEKIEPINEEQTNKDDLELNYDDNLLKDNFDEHYKVPTVSSSYTKWPIIVKLLEKDKTRGLKDTNYVCNSFEHQDTGNTESDTNNEKDKKYHTINPSYNSKYKVYEVMLPEYKDTSSPKTINVYIDKNIKKDEYDVKVIEENNSCTQERRKNNPQDQNLSLKDFVKNHKISEIIDILFNDENVTYNKPILFDCNGIDADIVNSDVKHSYSSGDLAEYHDDINGYFKNVDIDEAISETGSKQVNQDPKIFEISDTYVITDTANETVASSVVKDNSDEVSNYYYNLPFDEGSQTKELLTDEGTTSHSVNENPTILSLSSDNLTFTEILKQPNIITLPSTEAENAESTEYVPCKYSHNEILNEIPCECNAKNSADSYTQDISSSFTPNYELHPQVSPLFQYDVSNYSPGNSKTVQKLTKSSIKAVLDTDQQEPFYVTDEIPFLVNPEDYPKQSQIVYSVTVPIKDEEFRINDKISEVPSISSDTDTDAYHERSTKLSLDHGIPSIVVHDLEMPVSELSQKSQPVPIITSPHIVVEPLSDSQKSKTMELTSLSQISSIPELKPNYKLLDTESSIPSTNISPSINGTPFVKISQLSIPQDDASLAATITFSQSHLPEIIDNNKKVVLTSTKPVSSLPQSNVNFKAPKVSPYYPSPLTLSKTTEPPSVSSVSPSIPKSFSSFYSSDSQNMSPMSVSSWFAPIPTLKKCTLSTKAANSKSDIPISHPTMEIIPELLPVQNPTNPASSLNLQPMFTSINTGNTQINTYTDVTKAVPEIIAKPNKETLMIYPLSVHQVKPVHYIEEPCVDLLSTVPIPTNYVPDFSLPPVTPSSHISLLPSTTSSATICPLNYKNQVPEETSIASASPATNTLSWTHKYRQPTIYPISSVPTPTPTSSFYIGSPSILAPSLFWQFIPESQHPPSNPIKPPLPEMNTVASSFTHPLTLPIYTNLPEATQLTEQSTISFSFPINNKHKTYIPKLNSYKPSLDKQHYHISSSTEFLPIAQNFPKLSHPTAQLTKNDQLQQQFLITKVMPNNIVSNIMTDSQQPTEPYVESRIANQSTKGSSWISPSLKAVPSLDKILRAASPSSALEPLISTSTNYLSETSIPKILPYASELTPLLTNTDIKNDFQTRPSTVPLMLPTKANVTPLTSKQAIDLSYSSLSYSENLTDKKSSLYSSFAPISSSPSMPSARSTMNLNPVEIMPEIIPEFSMPVKESKLISASSTLLPNPADSLSTPHVPPYEEYWQVLQPNLFKSNAPYMASFKAEQPISSTLPSTTLLPYLSLVKPVSEIAVPLAKDTLSNQSAILNTLSGFSLLGSNVDATHLLEGEMIPMKPVPFAHSTVLSTAPVEGTKSRILSTIPTVLPETLPIPPTAFYTSSILSEGNRQPISLLKWSESLPICNKPQRYIHQSASPALTTPTTKKLSSDSTTKTDILSPVTTPIYSTSLSGTFPSDEIISPLLYHAKHPYYTYQALPPLQSLNLMADKKPANALIYKLSEPLNFVTPLSYSKSIFNNIPNVLKSSESFNFQEILPCEFEEPSAHLSPITYYSPQEKISKGTPNWITPYLIPNKKSPMPSLSPVKTITEPKISLGEIQTIPKPSLPSYTTTTFLSKPSPFVDPVSTAFKTLPLEETPSSIIPSPSLRQEGKLTSALTPLKYAPPLTYDPETIQDTVLSIPLKPSILTTSNSLPPKDIISYQQFPTQTQEVLPIYLPTSTPISASCLLETIHEGLKPLKLNNADFPKWRWSDISSSSQTIPITYITPVPLQSEVLASNLINTLEALPVDEVSKPLRHSYFPKYKPVNPESQSFSNKLSTPILSASTGESVESLLQALDINKPKYTCLKSVSGFPQPVLHESEYIPQIISPLQLSEMLNKPVETTQSPILNKYTPKFLKPLSQTVSTSPIHTNVPILLPISATPLSLLYRKPQKSKPCQWFSSSMLRAIIPTSATNDSYIPSSSNLSKESEPAVEPIYYPISETGVPSPVTSTSSPILPHTIVNKPLKVKSAFLGYYSNAANLQTPAVQLTNYPTSTLNYPKWKPSSNSNLASYLPMIMSTETSNPELSTAQNPVNALESNAPVKLLPASEYKLPYFYSTPISPFSPASTPVSNLVESSSLNTPVYTTPLKDNELNFIPLPKLPASEPYLKPIPFASPLKQNSQYITPLQSTYTPQSISDSLPLSASNLSKLTPYRNAALNVPRYIPSTTTPLYIPLSEQKFYECKPTPHSVLDTSNPIAPFISSVTLTEPSLFDSAVTSSVISPQTPLSQSVSPESSPTTSVPPASNTCSIISYKNLVVPPSTPISPLLPIRNTPKYVNTPLNINITERQTLPTLVPNTPYLQPKCLSPLPSKVSKVTPILPTIPSVPVQTSLPKSNTILDPQKLTPPSVTPVSLYLPMPTSSSQTTPGHYLHTTPYDSTGRSPMKSSVSYAPIKNLDPYSQYYEPHFTSDNVGSSQKSFTEYSSSLKYQSYYPSTCPLHSTKSSQKSNCQPISTSYISNEQVFTPIQKPSPYKFIFPIKRGQFGLIYPVPQLKPYTNQPPVSSTVVTAPITTPDYESFTNYMPTNFIASSSKPAMSTMSSTPAKHFSELFPVSINPINPVASAIPNDYTAQVVSELPSAAIKLKSDNDFITPIFSSLPKTSLNPLPFSSKVNSLLESELIYPQVLPMRALDVLPATSPTVKPPSFKQSSYYPSTYIDTVLKKDYDIDIDSNTALPAFKSLQPTHATPLSSTLMPASVQHTTPLLKPISSNPFVSSQNAFTKTYSSYSSLASNTNDYTAIKQLSPKMYPTPSKSKIALNSNPYSNVALNPFEVPTSLRDTQFIPFTSAEYMTPESVSLKLTNKIISPLSYSQPSSSKTLTPPAQYVTPLPMSVFTLQSPSPSFSKFSLSQYSPITFPVSSYPAYKYMPIESTHFPVHSTLTHTSTYDSEIPITSQSWISSLPQTSLPPLASEESSISNKGFSSLPSIQSSQFTPYASSLTGYENMQLTDPGHTIQNPISINAALDTKHIQPHNCLLSISNKCSSPFELMPSIESLPTSSPLLIPINPSSSSNLPNYNTIQSLFKPNLPKDIPLANQFMYDTSSLKNLKSNKDNRNEPTDSEPYYYFLNTYKTTEKSPLYNTATYPTVYSEPTSVASKDLTSDTDYFNDSLFKTYPLQPEYVSGKPNQFCDNNLSTVSKVNNFLALQKEINSKLYNYVNDNDHIKADIHNSNVDVSLPVGNILVAKKDCCDPMVYNFNPSVGFKMWPSNLKLLEAKLELKFKDVSVTNFQPVINDLATHDVNKVVNLIKNYIQNKYGKVIVLDNYLNNKYEIIKHCGSVNNKCNLLWPVDTSCNSAKPIVKYKGVV